MKRSKSILLHFYSADDLLYGINALQQYKVPIGEVYTPGHIDGIETKLKIKQLQLGYSFLKYGCLGGAAFTTLIYYFLEPAAPAGAMGKPLFALLLNVVVMFSVFVFATRLFSLQVPKIKELKRNDHRYLIVVDAHHIIHNEEIIHLLKYAEAVEISLVIKNMITA